MIKFFRKLSRDNAGVAAIEYGMLVAFIAMGLVSTVEGIGQHVGEKFESAKDGFESQ